jgi:predicted nucleic acid-binding protein
MRGHSQVKEAIQRADAILLTPVVLGELMAGFLRGTQPRRNQEELSAFLSSTRVGTLSLDDETAERYAAILHSLWNAGTPVPTNDIWIAASAMQHGLPVVTTDSHYRSISQILVDLYEP